MRDKTFKIVSQTLGLPVDGISEKLASSSCEEWDSIKHMDLMFALEESFDVEFNEEQMIKMVNVKEILETLNSISSS